MRRAAPLLVASVVVVGFMTVLVVGTDVGSSGFGSTTSVVFSRPAASQEVDRDLAVVESYWRELNAGDWRGAFELMAQPRADWEAESGLLAFHVALDRRFDATCESSTAAWETSVTCAVKLAGVVAADDDPARYVEVFRVRQQKIVRVERSEVTALSDAVLVREATLADPGAFAAACVDRPDRWYRLHGLIHDDRCGRFLASVTSPHRTLVERSATSWLLTTTSS